jgi:hypothetical protein
MARRLHLARLLTDRCDLAAVVDRTLRHRIGHRPGRRRFGRDHHPRRGHRPGLCALGRQPESLAPIGHRHRRQARHLDRANRLGRRVQCLASLRWQSRRGLRRHGHLIRGELSPGYRPLLAVNIDDQPRRVRQQKRRILRDLMHIQHDPRHIVRELRRPHPRQEAVVGHRKALARKLRGELGMMQVKEDAVRMLDPRRLIPHRIVIALNIEVDRDPRIRRRGPVADARHRCGGCRDGHRFLRHDNRRDPSHRSGLAHHRCWSIRRRHHQFVISTGAFALLRRRSGETRRRTRHHRPRILHRQLRLHLAPAPATPERFPEHARPALHPDRPWPENNTARLHRADSCDRPARGPAQPATQLPARPRAVHAQHRGQCGKSPETHPSPAHIQPWCAFRPARPQIAPAPSPPRPTHWQALRHGLHPTQAPLPPPHKPPCGPTPRLAGKENPYHPKSRSMAGRAG